VVKVNHLHLEFLVVHRELNIILLRTKVEHALEFTDILYVQYNFDYLFMRCQHSKAVHRIFFIKMVHEPKMLRTTDLNKCCKSNGATKTGEINNCFSKC